MTTLALLVLLLPSIGHAEWRPIGPWGGAAEVVRTLPGANGGALAATRTGLLFRSDDGGSLWRPVTFAAPGGSVLHALEVDPRSASVWYVGVESPHAARAAGVYRTVDAGRTWTLLPGTEGLAVWSLAIAPSNPDVIAAGTQTGVYLSRDHAATWTLISRRDDPEFQPVVSLAFDPSTTETLYAGTTHLPWRTTDGGATWQSIHAGMIDDSDVFSIVVDPRRPGRVLASACSGAYISLDGGRRWTRFATPAGAFRVYFVALDPSAPAAVFAGTSSGLLRSADEGRTWTRVTAVAVKSMAFDRAEPGRLLFASADAGLLRSGDGGRTVHESNHGFANRTVTSLTAVDGLLRATTTTGTYVSKDLGKGWTAAGKTASAAAKGAEWAACAIPAAGAVWYGLSADPADTRIVLAATSHGVFRSTDACRSWTAVTSGLQPATSTAVLFHPSRAGEAWAAQAGKVFTSMDAGVTWTPLDTGVGLSLWASAFVVPVSASEPLFALVPGRGVFAWTAR